MSFVPPGTLENLSRMSSDQLNGLDFGVIKVSPSGEIQFYNKYESELAGVSPQDAVGKNFFTQVAVCTNNKLFFGKFKEGVSAGSLNLEFNYTFTYKMRPTNIKAHLYHDSASSTNWIMIKKR